MVEGKDAEEAVRKAGVDYAQGWLYGRAGEKPVDQAQLNAFLTGSGREGQLAMRAANEKKKEWG
jgi:EAL domain-containing protein (putative c-di-GMP-specific phosphodiesterase class I)